MFDRVVKSGETNDYDCKVTVKTTDTEIIIQGYRYIGDVGKLMDSIIDKLMIDKKENRNGKVK